MSQAVVVCVVVAMGCASSQDRELRRLLRERDEAQVRLASALETIEEYRLIHGPLPEFSSTKGGRVIGVKGRRVAITLGSRDGIQPGDVLFERRDHVYVGKLRVLRVEKDTAVAELFDAVPEDAVPCLCDDVYE